MKKILIVSFLIFSAFSFSQSKCSTFSNMTENETSISIPEDSVITMDGWAGSMYLDDPLYIKNKEYVVYQKQKVRKIIHPDIESFRIVDDQNKSSLAVDKNGIYFQGIFINADTTGIRVVGCSKNSWETQWLWKTKDKVFKNENELVGIDAESFLPIWCFNGDYFKDKNFVYHFDKKIYGSDGSSVSQSCNEKCYDDNHVYIDGKIATYEGEKLKPVNDVLAKTETQVIAISTMLPIPDIDASSLKKLSRKYSMDKDHVYYGVSNLPILKSNLKNVKVWDQLNSAYVTDGIKVYKDDGVKEPEYKLDARTFGMLPYSDFFYDKNGIYQLNSKDYKVVLDKFPFKYKESVTAKNTLITDNSRYIVYCNQAYDPWDDKFYPDLNTVQVQNLKKGGSFPNDEDPKHTLDEDIGYLYKKKGDQIFIGRSGELLYEVEDVKSFEPISFYYSKDKNNVYYLKREDYSVRKRSFSLLSIPDVDPSTFTMNILAYDKNDVYVGGEKLISSESIEFLAVFKGYRPGCGQDRNPTTNYIFMKNSEGFWLLQTYYIFEAKVKLQYLGKTFNPKWNEVFEDFELF